MLLRKKASILLQRPFLKKPLQLGLTGPEVTDFQALTGNGLSAALGSDKLIGGSMKYISTLVPVSNALMSQAEKLAEAGKTPAAFCP